MISLSHLQNLIKKYFSQRNLIICLTLGSSLFLITSLTRKINRSIVNRKYHQTISKLHTQRNNECEAFIAKYSNTIAKELQQKILSYSFVELSEKLCSNELSSVEIYLTYAFRAASLGRSLKLIADIDLESGLKQAELRDLERKKDPKKCSSIHGLPISVKDHITCKGLKTTLGYVCNADNERWDHDCCLIDLLRNKGAIIFTHSNIPQGLVSLL